MNRDLALGKLKTESFDICIIGGGASGAGCALDAVLRGYKVALIDEQDFASQTSSRSTKLIHGGVRYLEQAFKKLDFGQLKQVRHGLQERHIVLSLAPHLARPLPLLTPVGSWIEGLYFTIGLKLYDQFAAKDSLPKSRWLNKKEVLEKMPTLNRSKLHSAVLYYDGQLDDARYCLAMVRAAAQAGAVVANYIGLQDFDKDDKGKITGLLIADSLTGERSGINSKLVINCTGPYADRVRLLANTQLTPRMRPSKGVHISLPAATLKSNHALLIPKTSDGRVVFAIPFEGGTMLGTTDTEYQALEEEPCLTKEEKMYLADTLNPYLEKPIALDDIKAGFGGLRPLLNGDGAKSTKSLVRDHEVEVEPVSGLISLLGGKWTTYRLMAKDTIDEVDRLMGEFRPCTTETHILTGGVGYRYDLWKQVSARYGLDTEMSQHLLSKYGSLAMEVAELTLINSEWKHRIHKDYPYCAAEVIYGVRKEMVLTLRDFLARRTRLEIMDWDACLLAIPYVADLMASELNWTEQQKNTNVEEYSSLLENYKIQAGVI
ncbi:glycerol-3-phosphate dehydrogenase/oxidase [Dyadobacter tibetensis]|uniref:glycerol-3-phosphate dehydrogenase/oxidase n=1 Tax=Dyadobacter tibetensis TaxID=1211851 RepID=UPI00046EB881|nr:FAD-dependent oxidoreductase [Dyadobacter tibetensis]